MINASRAVLNNYTYLAFLFKSITIRHVFHIIEFQSRPTKKNRTIIVLTLYIECNFSLKVFFFFFTTSFSPVHPETVNCCIFPFVSTFVATWGKRCLVSVQRDCNLENKGKNCSGTDFKIEVAATLPELSDWTLTSVLATLSDTNFLKLSQTLDG